MDEEEFPTCWEMYQRINHLYLQDINTWFFLKSLLFHAHSKPFLNNIMPSLSGRI